MREIKFKKTMFYRDKSYYTVRLGDAPFYLDEEIRLIGLQNIDNPTGRAVVEKIIVCHYQDIPDEVFELEHDPTCRDRLALLDKMNRYYEEKVLLDSVVTCLLLRRIE